MFKLACIGLDTSHATKFTELIQGPDKKADGLKVVSCQRFPTPFFPEDGQDERQQTMEDLGVKVTRSFEEAVEGVDGIMIEINDPAMHLEYFEKSAKLGLPIFLDKPMCDNVVNARKIYEMSKGLRVWSASSLRFTTEIIDCCKNVPSPSICNTFGPLGNAPAGSSVVWYGVHAFEMLMTIMGPGAESVTAIKDDLGVVSVVKYADGRRGIVDCNSGFGKYGGRAISKEAADTFIVNFANAGSLYGNLITALADFYLKGILPVPLEHTFEIQAMLNAAENSIASGKAEPVEKL